MAGGQPLLIHAVDSYVAVRRAAGFALTPIAGSLRQFARFAGGRGEPHVITRTAIAWATLAPSEAQRASRLQPVRRFAHCMHAEAPRHAVPPADVVRGRRQRPIPDIFAADELQQLLGAAGRLGPPGALRPHTSQTLFGRLAVTGLRVAEARHLHGQDVTADGVRIRATKFQKSRLLPRHVTTRAALEPSLARRRQVAGLDVHLSVTRRGGPLSRTVITQTFHRGLTAAGIPQGPGRRRPRLIDLRHTFAVRALEASPETRDAIGRHTIALTTYMGHPCVASTYWSLDSPPQLMADSARSCATLLYGGPA